MAQRSALFSTQRARTVVAHAVLTDDVPERLGSHSQRSPCFFWRTYFQLTDAEAAFRIHKTDLSIRPVWHQITNRVLARIFVCFLAYVLWKTLEQWQKRAGLGNSPRTILDELSAIQSTDVILPSDSNPMRELRVRCVVRPDKAQSYLLDRLRLSLPERLRPALAATRCSDNF